MPETEKHKRFTYDCHDSVQVVRFCPLEFNTDILAVGTALRVLIICCKAKEERTGISGVEFEQIAEYNNGCRVIDICWSQQTDLLSLPRVLRLTTAGSDNQVRCLTSDLKTETTFVTVGEHKGYINAIANSLDDTDSVASVGDDNTCRVWQLSRPTEQPICFMLTSPGMAVCWHANDPGKILVAEKRGILRFYSTVSQRAFMSLECGHSPLVDADWSLTNELRVAVLAGTDWFIFDTSRSSHPLENKQAHSEGGRSISWSRSHDHLLATTGQPGFQLKVFNIRTSQAILVRDLKITNGLSWHNRLPLVAVGGDEQIILWAVDVI